MRPHVAPVFLAALGSAELFASTPPSGFVENVLLTGAQVQAPTGLAYEPGSGALFVLEKGPGSTSGTARVLRRDPSSGQVTTALTLSCVDSSGERGLLGIAFDPGYLVPGGAERRVYLYYTRDVGNTGTPCASSGFGEGEYNWVVRYRESGGVLTDGERVFSGPRVLATNHQAGTLRFHPDGTLFVSMGDDNSGSSASPHPRNLADLRGKILRITRDGGVPPDNPFVGMAGRRPEIWAYGFRNPFRFSIDPSGGTVWIGDVGEARWEEIDRGIAGADFGWPCFEANEAFRTCDPPPAPGSWIAPTYAYGHGGQTTPVEGNSITMGPVYRANAFPAAFRGNLYFGDYGRGWIRRARVGSNGTLSDLTVFVPDASGVVDMQVSPAGCLTWVGITGSGVREICAQNVGNSPPTAVASATPTSGLAPLNVSFNGSGSSDPDGDALAYLWDFDDAGTSTAASPSHSYAANGIYDATLTVNDGRGQANSAATAGPIRVVVGNRAPVPTVVAPAPGTRYDAGDTIGFQGGATDPDDGTLPASAYTWTIVFHHDHHTHPFLGPTSGMTAGSFEIPTDGEESTNVFYRIHMDVRDSGASLGPEGVLESSAFVDVVPNVSLLTVAVRPAGRGLSLSVDGTAAVAPWSKASVVGFRRRLTAPSPQVVNGITWEFVSWSDGGAADHTLSAPASNTTYTATYRCIANCSTVDSDGDAVPDLTDNCPAASNGSQADFDDDGYGDACETGARLADTDLSGRVDGADLTRLGRAFASACAQPAYDASADVDRDCGVDGDDLAILAAQFGVRP